MLTETGSVHLNLILDNPISSPICINILPEEEFLSMINNELNPKTETHQTLPGLIENNSPQKDRQEKIDLFIYQYKGTLVIRLNGKWVRLG